MPKILAIDYGTKRIGLAFSEDIPPYIAFPLDTIPREAIMDFIEKYIQEDSISTLVIGHPRELDGKDCPLEKDIAKFIKKFQLQYPNIPIKRIDERFSSKLAFSSLLEGGIKKKKRRDKALLDKISAAIILESYINQNKK